MKKVYLLQVEGKNPARLMDATKHDIRKYLKRCRAAPLPAGVDFWDFDCALGADKTTATAVHLSQVIPLLDAAAAQGQLSVYIEILPKNGHRMPKAAAIDGARDAIE